MDIPFTALLLALLAGLAVGLLPGLHPNSIGAILMNTLGSPDWLPVVLIAMLGMRTALEFLPSIFLGVPDSDTEVSVLPGQRMLREGKAAEAVMICAVSVVAAAGVSLLISPLVMTVVPGWMAFVKPWTGWLLMGAAGVLLVSEAKLEKMGKALLVFGLAALLGALALSSPLIDPLFPLFVGFFTLPTLLGVGEGGKDKTAKPKTPEKKPHLDLVELLPYILAGVVLGGLADLLPGISTPAQIAVFASLLVPLTEARHFLALVASIAASHATLALTTAASTGIARVGAVAMAQQMVPLRPESLPAWMGVFVVSVGIGALCMLVIGRWIGERWDKIDWSMLGKVVGVYLIGMVGLTGGWMGLAVLGTATAIGTLPIFFGVRRTHVMGSLIGPSIWRALMGAS